MTARRLRLPQSILGHTMLLVISIIVLLTILNLSIIFFRPPPRDVPVSAYEVSRLLKGELLVSVRTRNPKVPRTINDIVLKAMAPEVHARYQRASDLLDDIFSARDKAEPARAPRVTPPSAESANEGTQDIQTRLRARETPQARFCWHCRKPLHARTDRCPFCGETQ